MSACARGKLAIPREECSPLLFFSPCVQFTPLDQFRAHKTSFQALPDLTSLCIQDNAGCYSDGGEEARDEDTVRTEMLIMLPRLEWFNDLQVTGAHRKAAALLDKERKDEAQAKAEAAAKVGTAFCLFFPSGV